MVRFKLLRWPMLAFGAALLATCAANQAALREAQAGISLDYLISDIATLGSDEFMGRKPGQPGGDLAVDYLVKRAQEIGLEPGNGDSYLQDVPLLNFTLSDASQMTLGGGSEPMIWKPYEDRANQGPLRRYCPRSEQYCTGRIWRRRFGLGVGSVRRC